MSPRGSAILSLSVGFVVSVFVGSGFLLTLVRDDLHFQCSFLRMGNDDPGSFYCADGISYIGVGLGTYGVYGVILLVALGIASASPTAAGMLHCRRHSHQYDRGEAQSQGRTRRLHSLKLGHNAKPVGHRQERPGQQHQDDCRQQRERPDGLWTNCSRIVQEIRLHGKTTPCGSPLTHRPGDDEAHPDDCQRDHRKRKPAHAGPQCC